MTANAEESAAQPLIILAGTYPPERLASMERYMRLVEKALRDSGQSVLTLQPRERFGQAGRRFPHLAKISTYVDKYILFPKTLTREVARHGRSRRVLLHVLDQGNSLYVRGFTQCPVVVTCHDLIAAKSRLRQHEGVRRNSFGQWHHQRNLDAMLTADTIVCASDKTLTDCREFAGRLHRPPHLTRVYNPLSPEFETPLPVAPAASAPFLLHVGNSAWYKNRIGLLHIYAALRPLLETPPPLHLYGEPLRHEETSLIRNLGLNHSVVSHPSPSDGEIHLAYHQAEALVFPSLEEGFGWPPLEAMACGCPVFASNRPPLTEIGGTAIQYFDPEKPAEAAQVIASKLKLGRAWRTAQGELGRKRAAQFSLTQFADELNAVYRSTLNRPVV